VDKITPKNSSFYQEFIGLYGTFAIPENRGWIIDKSRARNDERRVITTAQSELLKLAKKYRRNANGR
jgi:hypothetical protein